MAGGPLIVVHQMAKVASLAWVEAARPRAKHGGGVPLHTHYLTAGNLAAVEAIVNAAGGANTIVHLLVVRTIARKGRAAAAAVARARAEARPIAVIAGMRDPVARSISLVSFLADFCGYAGGPLSARDEASAEAVCAFLRGVWDAVLAGTEPAGSFERLAWLMIGAYRTWFSEELRTVFDIDIFSAPFPSGGGAQLLGAAGVEALIYRAEDMTPGGATGQALQNAAKAFLKAPDFAWPQVNTAATRRSWPLYRETQERFRLPAASLDEIYDAAAVKHFYGPDEIATFKARWGGGPG